MYSTAFSMASPGCAGFSCSLQQMPPAPCPPPNVTYLAFARMARQEHLTDCEILKMAERCHMQVTPSTEMPQPCPILTCVLPIIVGAFVFVAFVAILTCLSRKWRGKGLQQKASVSTKYLCGEEEVVDGMNGSPIFPHHVTPPDDNATAPPGGCIQTQVQYRNSCNHKINGGVNESVKF